MVCVSVVLVPLVLAVVTIRPSRFVILSVQVGRNTPSVHRINTVPAVTARIVHVLLAPSDVTATS